MNSYTNGFRCSVRDGGSEVVIHFVQESPAFDNEGQIVGSEYEPISSLVMHANTAAILRDALTELLGKTETEE